MVNAWNGLDGLWITIVIAFFLIFNAQIALPVVLCEVTHTPERGRKVSLGCAFTVHHYVERPPPEALTSQPSSILTVSLIIA